LSSRFRKEAGVEEAEVKAKKAAEADAVIARRLAEILRITREDEERMLLNLKMRQLERRARKTSQNK
jgi:hypothetical protein